MVQIELFNPIIYLNTILFKQTTDDKLNYLDDIEILGTDYLCVDKIIRRQYLKLFNCVQKISTGSLKIIFSMNYSFTNIMFLIHVYKEDLALDNLQWLICHKIEPNQIIYI